MDTPKLETITPAKAAQYMNRNNGNRKLREGVAEKYAADMRAGLWTECAAPIWFYDNGDVADGQHRLWAIIDSETTQKFLVGHNFARNAGLNIDTHAPRGVVDNARISGRDSGLSNELVALGRAIEIGDRHGMGSGKRRESLSNSQKIAYVDLHREAADLTIANGPRGRGVRNAVVLSAVARAWYHEKDKDKLRRFCEVLSSGHSDGTKESAAVTLRNYLTTKFAPGAGASIHNAWRDTLLKTENAIHYFVREKQLMAIKAIQSEVYPLKKKRQVAVLS